MHWQQRAAQLPFLGLGVSTEYGAIDASNALDVLRLRQSYPQFACFLELGIETSKGLDSLAETWLQSNAPTTYHFLDINLDDPRDFEESWLKEVKALIEHIHPAWLCGDAGLWHIGKRDRGQMLLLPPILTDASSDALAAGIRRLRQQTGQEVLPENPPGAAYVGDMHLLDFFARVLLQADTGMLLDCAHLAIYQHALGFKALEGLNRFPLDRVVEIHIAGGKRCEQGGFKWIEDDHTPDVLPETWEIAEYVLERAANLKAVVFECERNSLEACLPGLEKIAALMQRPKRPYTAPSLPLPAAKKRPQSTARIQQVVAGMLHDPVLVERVYSGKRIEGLEKAEQGLITRLDRRSFATDPHRRARLLQALIEEYPVSTAILGLDAVDAFLSSKAFHQALSEYSSLALSFGFWLTSQADSLARLEYCIAEARRYRPHGKGYQRQAGIGTVSLPAGFLEQWQRFKEGLGPEPLSSLLQGARAHKPVEKAEREWVLIEGDTAGLVSEELWRAIQFMQSPRTLPQVLKELRRLQSEGEEEEILKNLLNEKLICCLS